MKILNQIIKFGLFLALLIPITFTSTTMQPWHFGKTIIFQILVEILVFLAIIYFSLNKEKPTWKFNWLDYLVILFPIFQIFSALAGVNLNRSFWGDQQRVQGIFTWLNFTAFYVLLRLFWQTKKDWLYYGSFALFIGFISSLIALFGYKLAFLEGMIVLGPRISGLIGNPIFYSAYIILPTFLGFIVALALKEKHKWLALIAGLAGMLNLLTLILSGTRGAFVGLLAGVGSAFVLYLYFLPNKKTKLYSFGILAMLVCLFVGLVFFNLKSDYLKNSLPRVSTLLDLSTQSTTVKTRLMAWEIALQGWRDRPLLGWGPENFQDAFDKHYNPEFLKYSFAETVWDKPHSYPLEVLNNMGIEGFLAYLAIVLLAIYFAVKSAITQTSKKEKIILIISAGAIIAYVVQGSFAFETSNSLMLWLSLLAFVSFYHQSQNNQKQLNNETIEQKNNQAIIIATNLFSILILIATPYAIYKNCAMYHASVLMSQASDNAEIESLYQWQKNAELTLGYPIPFIWEQAIFLTKDLSIFDAKGLFDQNAEPLKIIGPKLASIFETNIKAQPNSYLMRFWAGQLYTFMGQYVDQKYYARAEEILLEAIAINQERQSVAMILAKTYLLEGKTEEGVKTLEEVQKLNLDYGEAHWFLGLALIQSGKKEQGITELEKGASFGLESNEGNMFYMIELYNEQKAYAKIVPLYQKIIARHPDNPQYYANLAATYAVMGDKDNLVLAIKQAVALQPELRPEAIRFLEENNIDISKINF